MQMAPTCTASERPNTAVFPPATPNNGRNSVRQTYWGRGSSWHKPFFQVQKRGNPNPEPGVEVLELNQPPTRLGLEKTRTHNLRFNWTLSHLDSL